jgi:HK97 family phage prohead protease
MDFVIAPLELKLAAGGQVDPGTFSGYAAVFGNVDSHGDVIAPGAFKASLDQRAAIGRRNVPMHVQHAVLGGDGLPVGVWSSVAEDSKGLRVEGKISGMDTDVGRLHYARLKDGAYGGLSIGFRTKKASDLKGSGTGKRLVEQVELHEISLVSDPSNAQAIVEEFKAREGALGWKDTAAGPKIAKATAAIGAALALHRTSMTGGDSPDADERSQFLGHLQDAHEALTGNRMPDGMKSARTQRDFVEIFVDMGIPAERATALAADAFKSARKEPSGETKTALSDLSGLLSDFRLPTLG